MEVPPPLLPFPMLLDKPFATPTLKSARPLVPPTLSVDKREVLMPSLEELTVRPMELARTVRPLLTLVALWTVVKTSDKPLVIHLLSFASILSLATTTTIALLLLMSVEVRTVKATTNASTASSLTPLPPAQPATVVKPLANLTATKPPDSASTLATTTTIALELKEPTAWTTVSAWIAEPMLIAKLETHGTEIRVETPSAVEPSVLLLVLGTAIALPTKIA